MGIEFGKKYRDKIHGLEGVATARTEYMTGCIRVCLEVLDGKVIKENWFDETQLENVDISPEQVKPGGPGAIAPSRDPA